mmetsp:Transcript_36537/g.82752  ORF Transcript_36537/g.82752 Transcript_36537/m.82752 type:complete len:285 (-) Transcript_36537:1350-2204(-)
MYTAHVHRTCTLHMHTTQAHASTHATTFSILRLLCTLHYTPAKRLFRPRFRPRFCRRFRPTAVHSAAWFPLSSRDPHRLIRRALSRLLLLLPSTPSHAPSHAPSYTPSHTPSRTPSHVLPRSLSIFGFRQPLRLDHIGGPSAHMQQVLRHVCRAPSLMCCDSAPCMHQRRGLVRRVVDLVLGRHHRASHLPRQRVTPLQPPARWSLALGSPPPFTFGAQHRRRLFWLSLSLLLILRLQLHRLLLLCLLKNQPALLPIRNILCLCQKLQVLVELHSVALKACNVF